MLSFKQYIKKEYSDNMIIEKSLVDFFKTIGGKIKSFFSSFKFGEKKKYQYFK